MVQRKKLRLVLDFRHINPHIQITKAVQFCSLQARDILCARVAKYLGKSFNFETHNLCAGAASHSANSSNVPDSALDKHVGWKSAKSKFCCIKDSEAALMHIYFFFFTCSVLSGDTATWPDPVFLMCIMMCILK